jgi:hypothetical protein
VGLRPLAYWDYGFEFHLGHGCLSLVSVVCCQVEVSATDWSLVQRSPTECGVFKKCVIVKPRKMRRPRPPRGCRATGKKKRYNCPCAGHKGIWSRMQFLPSTLESNQLHAWAALPRGERVSNTRRTGESGWGGIRAPLSVLQKKKISCLVGDQTKISLSASSLVTTSTELSPLSTVFYSQICGRNPEHCLCSCNVITRLRGMYSLI